MQNPFLGLYQLMGEATKIEASFFLAKVISPLPDLKVQLDDIELDKEDLLIDKWIKDRNEQLFTEYIDEHNHIANCADCSCVISHENRHRHEIKEPIHDKLKVDDKVVLLRLNEKFIVISKVVEI